MIQFKQPIADHFASRLGIQVDDLNLSDLLSMEQDIPGVVEDHQEWFDAIYPSRIGEVSYDAA